MSNGELLGQLRNDEVGYEKVVHNEDKSHDANNKELEN